MDAKASQVCFYRKFNSYDFFFFTTTPVPERGQGSNRVLGKNARASPIRPFTC